MNTLKKIILLFLLFGNLGLSAQTVQYEPIFINQRTHEIDTFIFFTILDQNYNEITWNKFPNNIVELADTGMYKMDLGLGDMTFDIHIDNYGYFSDTFNAPIYRLSHHISNPPKTDYYCGENLWECLCNGLLIDYYYNGNIHLIGTFRNGQPIDTLKEYYENGDIRFIGYYSPNKYVQKKPYRVLYRWYKVFDKEGKCTEEYNNKRADTLYYPNGKLRYILDHINRHNYQEYYENGNPKIITTKRSEKEYRENGSPIYIQIRRIRKDYHENGIVSVFSRASKISFIHDEEIRSSHIRFRQYDSTGRYIQKGELQPKCGFWAINSSSWSDYKTIIYNTRPKSKDIIYVDNIYENNEWIAYKATKTTYQKQKGKWMEIKKEYTEKEWKDYKWVEK